MDQQPPDLTPLWYIVGAGIILGLLRWLAKRLLMISPTHAALEQLSADQRAFHDRLMADVKVLHDAVGALAGHQEAQDARLAYLEGTVRLKAESR